MRIIARTLAAAALLFAVALPVTAASAACHTDPYCNPNTPDAGGSDNGRTFGRDTDRGGTSSNNPGGDVAGEATTGGGEVGGSGEVEPAAAVDAVEQVAEVDAAGVETARSAPSGTLPLTGGDVLQLALIGVGAVAVGTVLVRRSRVSSAATPA